MKLSIQEMHELFEIVQDKYNEDYFTTYEIDVLLNTAQQLLINEIIFGEYYPSGTELISGLEINKFSSSILSSLIEYNISASSNANSIITSELINDAIETKIGNDVGYMYIYSIFDEDGEELSYIRHNDYSTFKDNYFKPVKSDRESFLFVSDGIKIVPPDPSKQFTLTVVRNPIKVDLNTGIDCELNPIVHEKLVAIALEQAGIATMNEALVAINRSS